MASLIEAYEARKRGKRVWHGSRELWEARIRGGILVWCDTPSQPVPVTERWKTGWTIEEPEPEGPERRLVKVPARRDVYGTWRYWPRDVHIDEGSHGVGVAPADERFGQFVGYEVRDPVRDETFLSRHWPVFEYTHALSSGEFTEENLLSGKLVRCELISCVFLVEEGE